MYEFQKTEEFGLWLSALRDQVGKAKIIARIKRLELGNPGDVRDVGEGVSELRVNFGPGYRVYYKRTGRLIVLLLCGGDKSTQDSDIREGEETCGGMKGFQKWQRFQSSTLQTTWTIPKSSPPI